jgi:hypothetical protein
VEINNIGDILKVIDTYKIDPSIKYNINMKALHDIKEPLIELNNMIGMKTLKNNIELNVETSMKILKHLYLVYKDWKIAFGAYNTGKPMINQYALDVYNYNLEKIGR